MLGLVVVLTGCGNSNLRSKEKVQQAILQRLQTRSGLDLTSLDVTTTSVSFDNDKAYATVAFHPKNDPRIDNGMVMKYTLEARDGKWVVVNVGDSEGHGAVGRGAGNANQLPPGHPQVGEDQLPPGHPPVDAHAPAARAGADGRSR